jgi:hypothetical protein
VLDVTCKIMYEEMTGKRRHAEKHTADLLLAIAGDGAEDGVLLSDDAVCSSVDVVLCASGVVLGLAAGMLFAAGLLPGGSPSEVTNCLYDGTLDRVELASGLAARGSARADGGE